MNYTLIFALHTYSSLSPDKHKEANEHTNFCTAYYKVCHQTNIKRPMNIPISALPTTKLSMDTNKKANDNYFCTMYQQFCHHTHIKRPMTVPILALCTAILSPYTHKKANDWTNSGLCTAIVSPYTHKVANECTNFWSMYCSFVTRNT